MIQLATEAASSSSTMILTGQLAASILDRLAPHVVPGVTTAEIDDLARTMMLDAGAVPIDPDQALAAQAALAPVGGLTAEMARQAPLLKRLSEVLGCCTAAACAEQALPAGCDLSQWPQALTRNDADRADLGPPLGLASTVAQTFLLEYLEGKPMTEVGWGRVSRAEIEQLLRFHPLEFRYLNRPGYIAAAAAAPIVHEIVTALGDRRAARLTLLVGHDTNVADLGGFFDLHWQVPSYPADEVPPGSALGFELVSTAGGDRYVRAFYRAQTMDQLRNLEALGSDDALFRRYLPIPGCGDSVEVTACRWNDFARIAAPRG